MVIQISTKLWKKALNGEKIIQREIRRILIAIADGLHELYIDKDDPIDQILDSNLFPDLEKSDIKKFSRKTITQFKPTILVTTQDFIKSQVGKASIATFFDNHVMTETQLNNQTTLCIHFVAIEASKTYLCQPLSIVVENDTSDQCFLQNVYNFINPTTNKPTKEFEILAEYQIIEIIHGGGSTTYNQLERIIHPRRVLCIIDSDKKYPTDTLNDLKIAEYQKICNEKDFTFMVLKNSEIENYLPDKSLLEWLFAKGYGISAESCKSHDYFSANFTAMQKKFFDMKKGLKPTNFTDPTHGHQIQVLYSTQYKKGSTTIKGFGNEVFEAFNHLNICTLTDIDAADLLEFKKITQTIQQLI